MNPQEMALEYFNKCVQSFPDLPKELQKDCAKTNVIERRNMYNPEEAPEKIAFLDDVLLEIDKL